MELNPHLKKIDHRSRTPYLGNGCLLSPRLVMSRQLSLASWELGRSEDKLPQHFHQSVSWACQDNCDVQAMQSSPLQPDGSLGDTQILRLLHCLHGLAAALHDYGSRGKPAGLLPSSLRGVHHFPASTEAPVNAQTESSHLRTGVTAAAAGHLFWMHLCIQNPGTASSFLSDDSLHIQRGFAFHQLDFKRYSWKRNSAVTSNAINIFLQNCVCVYFKKPVKKEKKSQKIQWQHQRMQCVLVTPTFYHAHCLSVGQETLRSAPTRLFFGFRYAKPSTFFLSKIFCDLQWSSLRKSNLSFLNSIQYIPLQNFKMGFGVIQLLVLGKCHDFKNYEGF